MAERCLRLREKAEAARQAAKAASDQADAADLDLLTAMDQAKMKTISLQTGEQFTATTRHVFSLPPKDEPERRAEALTWLRRVGAKELVEENIHPNTLLKFLRERLEAGKSINPLIKDVELKCLRVTKTTTA